MLKIQEALDLIIEHYIDELREARLGGRHTIPDRYALTILEETEAIRNYVKPVLVDRIRELNEQVPKIKIEDLTGEIKGKEGKTSSVWHTGEPTEEGDYWVWCELIEDNCLPKSKRPYVGFWKANEWWDNYPFTTIRSVLGADIVAWQKITPYKET